MCFNSWRNYNSTMKLLLVLIRASESYLSLVRPISVMQLLVLRELPNFIQQVAIENTHGLM